MDYKELSGTFKLKISTTIENIPENDIETLRLLVEEDLKDLGYFVKWEN